MGIVDNVLMGASGNQGYNLQRSLRFRASASAYLSKTPASTSNQKTFTWSGWVKRGIFSSTNLLNLFGNSAASADYMGFYIDGFRISFGGGTYAVQTNAVYRDPASWYHVVIAIDTTQATAANRVLLYINGVAVTSFSSASYPTQNYNTSYNTSGTGTLIGQLGSANYFDGYMTEINFVDGQALTPSSFGSTNTITGVWQPKKYAGTYGTNGFYLPFTDNSALTTSSNVGLGKDFSGNTNYFTTSNISITAGVTYDSMTDVPTLTSTTAANYAVLNPLGGVTTGGPTLTDGNLNYGQGAAAWNSCGSTIQPNSGKWYFEVSGPISGSTYSAAGLRAVGNIGTGEYTGSTAGSYGAALSITTLNAYSNAIAGGSISGTFSVSTPIQIAVDFDTGKIWIGSLNGTWIGGGNPASGTTPTYTFTASTQLNPYVSAYSNNTYANFGQRPFTYTAPTGFLPLNTYNI